MITIRMPVIELLSRGKVSGFVRRLISLHLEPPKPAASTFRTPTHSPAPKEPNFTISPAPPPSLQMPRPGPKPSVKNVPAPVPTGMPPILWQRCPENRWRPVFENNQMVRNPVSEQEKKAYEQWIKSRLKFNLK